MVALTDAIRGAAVALLLWGSIPSLHAETLWIDSAQSQAGFALRALWVKRIDGDFTRVEGVIEPDRDRGRFGVDVRIAAASVRMDKTEHADWARGPDCFDAARHPWIQFRAAAVPERVLHDGGDVPGELTLRGITRKVSFTVAPSECPRPGIGCPVRARGEVQRSEFGMEARRFLLGNRVRLSFEILVHDSGVHDSGAHDSDPPASKRDAG